MPANYMVLREHGKEKRGRSWTLAALPVHRLQPSGTGGEGGMTDENGQGTEMEGGENLMKAFNRT